MKKEDYNFEDAMKRLEEIVRILEDGKTSLDESIKLYEEGVALVANANKLLADAKQKLITVSGEAQGND
ncbi:MAG: exodeoxyribonuclease VII small subunit [Eubacteriales bacterium]